MMKRGSLFWFGTITAFVIACWLVWFVIMFARYKFHGDEDAGALAIAGHYPLVVIGGKVTPIPSTDGIILGGGSEFSASTANTINNASTTQTSQLAVREADTLHTAFEATDIVAFQQATFDTTAGPATAAAGDFEVTSSRAAGVALLTNTALIVSATGGDNNLAVNATHGTISCPDGAQLGPTGTGSLTTGGTSANLSGSTAIVLNQNVSDFAVPTGAGAASPQITIGHANTNDGWGLEVTNTSSTQADSGISVGLNTTPIAARGGYFLWRGAGGGIGGSVEGGIVMTSGTGYSPDAAANDVLVFNATSSQNLLFSSVPSGNAALKIDSNNNLNILHGTHLNTGGTAASLSCNGTGGTSCASASCNDISGTVLTNSAATICTITFNGQTYTTNPTCTISVAAAVATPPYISARSPTSITITTPAVTATDIDYICTGH